MRPGRLSVWFLLTTRARRWAPPRAALTRWWPSTDPASSLQGATTARYPCSSIFFLKKLYVRPLSLQRLRLGCSLSVYDPARADRQPAGAFKSSSTRRNGTSTVLNTRVTLYMHGAFHWAPHRCYMPHRHVCPKNPKKGAELFVTPPRSQALHNTLFGSVTTPFLPRTTSHSTQSRWEAAGSPPVAPGKLQEVVHPTRKAAGSSPPHPGGRGKSPAAPGKLREVTRLTREAVGSQEWLSAVSGASPYRPKTAFRREVVRKVDLGTSINNQYDSSCLRDDDFAQRIFISRYMKNCTNDWNKGTR